MPPDPAGLLRPAAGAGQEVIVESGEWKVGATLNFPLSTLQVDDSLSVIRQSNAHVMFENSPVNTQTGQPALDHIRAALELGMHAVTANKGPVVHGYRELTALAKSKGKTFGFESTVLGGSPVFSVFRETKRTPYWATSTTTAGARRFASASS